MISLLGLGDNTVDTYVDAGLQFPGGNTVNVAVFAARLGAHAGYLGCFGNDALGAQIEAALCAEGVDTKRCRHIDGANARARIGHRNGDRVFLGAAPGVRGAYHFTPQDFAALADWDHVHTSINSDLDADLPALHDAARALSYDFSEKWTLERLEQITPLLNAAFLSCPALSDTDAEVLLRRSSARLTIATRGAAGAIALQDGIVMRQPVVPTKVVDTLGAGDGFIAGTLTALLTGAPLPAAMEHGATFAATVCTWQGAFGHPSPIT